MQKASFVPEKAPRSLVWLGLLALTLYGVLLGIKSSPFAAGSDQSGYLNSARLFAAGTFVEERRIPDEFGPPEQLAPFHFVPLGFIPTPGNVALVSTYPPGVPLQLAVPGKVFGWRVAATTIQLLNALGAVWLCYLLARELGVNAWLAAAGAGVLAAFPVFLFVSIQTLSDTPATTGCLLTMWLALRSRKGHWSLVLACGAAFAMAVFVRPTNSVLLPALLLMLGFDLRQWVLCACGGLPGAAWLAYYNHTIYGGALRSGYGEFGALFQFEHFAPTVVHFAHWLSVFMPTVLLVLPFAALWRARTGELWALLLWSGAIVVLYTFYAVSRENWWCLRFILPALPPLIVAGLLGIQALTTRWRGIAAAVVAAWALVATLYWSPRHHALIPWHHDRIYADACAQAREIFPANALVVSNYTTGALYFYTKFSVLRWDQVERSDFIRYVEKARAASRPVCAMLFDEFEDEAFRDRTPGEWRRLASAGRIGLWELVSLNPPAQPPGK